MQQQQQNLNLCWTDQMFLSHTSCPTQVSREDCVYHHSDLPRLMKDIVVCPMVTRKGWEQGKLHTCLPGSSTLCFCSHFIGMSFGHNLSYDLSVFLGGRESEVFGE